MSDHVRRIGSIRVSPSDRNSGVQTDILTQAGGNYIHRPSISENAPAREVLGELLEHLGNDDTLIVYRLDRLARDEHSVENFQQQIEAMGVKLIVSDDQETTGDSDAN